MFLKISRLIFLTITVVIISTLFNHPSLAQEIEQIKPASLKRVKVMQAEPEQESQILSQVNTNQVTPSISSLESQYPVVLRIALRSAVIAHLRKNDNNSIARKSAEYQWVVWIKYLKSQLKSPSLDIRSTIASANTIIINNPKNTEQEYASQIAEIESINIPTSAVESSTQSKPASQLQTEPPKIEPPTIADKTRPEASKIEPPKVAEKTPTPAAETKPTTSSIEPKVATGQEKASDKKGLTSTIEASKPGNNTKGSEPSKQKEDAAPIPEKKEIINAKGKLPWPVSSYTISDKYGQRAHPGASDLPSVNNGIDIITTPGAAVKAVFDGKVLFITNQVPYSNIVAIDHSGHTSVYYFLDKVSVSRGENVVQGQSIGNIIKTERIPNFHFEIWKGQQQINPLPWLKN